MYIEILIVILLISVYFLYFKEEFNNLNFGFIGDHSKGNKEYYISSRYNFNLGHLEKKN